MPTDLSASSVDPPRSSSTASVDGTRIAWLSLGNGPGLVLVHGAMQSARSQIDLAGLLARSHTVHLLDRRGRGTSGPLPDAELAPELETEDVLAVVGATGSADVMGVSSGALIALRAALRSNRISRLAVFEPPLAVNGSIKLDLLTRFDEKLESGDLPGALAEALRAAEMGPPPLLALPPVVLRGLAAQMLRSDAKRRQAGEPHLADLAIALRSDFAVVRRNAETVSDFADVQARTLLLAGTRTRPYLRTAVDALERVVESAGRADLRGAGHGVTGNRAQRGRPELVAAPLSEFLG